MDKFFLITQNLEEVLTPEDLKTLLENKARLIHYIGFEISGWVHLGTGLMTALKIRDLQKAGVKCQIFLADWHSWVNDKLGGNLKKIREVALGYFKEAMKLSLETVGANPDKVDFILGTELYHYNDDYWRTVIEVSKNTTLARILRSIDIMGRKENEGIDFAKLIYPPMQVADIFHLRANIVQAGMDQRKAHVITRDVALQIKSKPLLNKRKEKIKPVCLHSHLILGLQKPPKYPISKEEIRELALDVKMSKSKPETCVFIHDSPEEIKRKIIRAFCPPKDISYNPPLDWMYWLVLPLKGEIKIKEKNYKFEKRDELLKDYEREEIHPMDLKESLIKELSEILKPTYLYFQKPKAKKLMEEISHI